MRVIGRIVGFLALVAAKAAAERRLALGSEAACALGAIEASSALRCHAEASETSLDTGRSLTVPSARRRLVTELAKRGRSCVKVSGECQ